MQLMWGESKIGKPAELKSLAERRLRFALGRFGNRIRAVSLSLVDANSRRGGVDKQCRVTVRLAPAGEIRVEEFDDKWEAALTRAIDRISRVVARRLARWSDHRGTMAMGGPTW